MILVVKQNLKVVIIQENIFVLIQIMKFILEMDQIQIVNFILQEIIKQCK